MTDELNETIAQKGRFIRDWAIARITARGPDGTICVIKSIAERVAAGVPVPPDGVGRWADYIDTTEHAEFARSFRQLRSLQLHGHQDNLDPWTGTPLK